MNVILVLIEVTLLGGLPIQISHITVAPIYGMTYLFFSWYISDKLAPQDGPQFCYRFLDPTLDRFRPAIALLGLLLVMTFFYAVFAFVGFWIHKVEGNIAVSLLSVVLCVQLLCRFRD